VSDRRFVVALAEDVQRAVEQEGTLVIDEIPGVVLLEADLSIATKLAHEGQYVGVYSSLEAAHRVFALFHHVAD
jgi:hypothetical protein